jgi:hypothetical protein
MSKPSIITTNYGKVICENLHDIMKWLESELSHKIFYDDQPEKTKNSVIIYRLVDINVSDEHPFCVVFENGKANHYMLYKHQDIFMSHLKTLERKRKIALI